MSSSRILFLAGIAGNILEWYDFIIYGYFATQFARLFFPVSDPTVSLILSFSAFAIGFFARPLGALFIGYLGDRLGRKPALLVSISLMAVPSILMLFLPTYQTLGILAPLLLTLLRLLQGFSAGGEYTTSITFLLEHSSPEKRGLWSSVNLFGAILGILLGSLVATLLHHYLEKDFLEGYGWRLAYLPTIFLALIGYIIRRYTYETPAFVKEALSPLKGFPLFYALKKYPRSFFLTLILSMVQGVAFYILFVYFPTYFARYFQVPQDKALFSNTLAMILLSLLILPFAYFSDLYGRRPFFLISLLLYALAGFFLNFYLIPQGYTLMLLSHLVLAFISGIFMSILPVTLAELFPVKVRSTSFAVLYNSSLALFGGTAPMVCTYFIEKKGFLAFPGLYLSGVTALAFLLSLFFLPETHPLKSKGTAQRS
jgi:MHS family proline/betaine transporter-like MFS transporter